MQRSGLSAEKMKRMFLYGGDIDAGAYGGTTPADRSYREVMAGVWTAIALIEGRCSR